MAYTHPHLTSDPWLLVDGPRFHRTANQIPMRVRALTPLDDKLRVRLRYELERCSPDADGRTSTECIIAQRSRSSLSVRVGCTTLPEQLVIPLPRALVTLRLRLSYLNWIPQFQEGYRVRTFKHCPTLRCVHPDHWGLKPVAWKGWDIPEDLDDNTPTLTDPFYKAFWTWMQQAELTEESADTWLREWQTNGGQFTIRYNPTDKFHPLTILETLSIPVADDLQALLTKGPR